VRQPRPTVWIKAIFRRAWRADRLAALLLMGGMLLIGACTPAVRPTAAPKAADIHLKNDEISRMNAMILSRTQPPGDPGEYLLGEGDLLRVNVFEAKELDTEVRVSSRGFITLPLIDAVNVKGLTAIEAEKAIERLYQQRFIKNPHVSVFVEEHISQRITLVGQFRKPGTYDYPTKRRLLDVIALGGGLSENAGPMVQIRKSRRVRGQPEVIVVDLDRLINRGDVQLNIEINGGDVVFIPEAGVFFVDGAVRRPGTYTIKHHSTIREALVEAGGFETWAIKDRIKLARLEDNGEHKLIDLDLSQPGVEDMAVKDRDILIVDESAAAGIMRGFSISFLGTGFSYYGR
jgi:polysaccharide biosynthesis/export protein